MTEPRPGLRLRVYRARRKLRREGPPAAKRLVLDALFRLRGAVLPRLPITLRVKNASAKFLPRGQIVAAAWTRQRFEADEIEFMSDVMAGGDCFLDIGANVGLFSLLIAQRYQSAQVWSFEPAPQTYALLEANIKLNNARNVTGVQTALGDDAGTVTLFVNSAMRDGLNALARSQRSDLDVVGSVQVPMVTLDDFASSREIGRIHAIKMDVEGAERLVLQGASSILESAGAPLIMFEAEPLNTQPFGYHPAELSWLLEAAGYELFVLSAGTLQPISAIGSDYRATIVAVKPAHPAYARVRPR